jgi:hypothetical protein
MEMCLPVHKTCENRNMTKKCKFEKCGCKVNIVDFSSKKEVDLAIKDILRISDNFYGIKN